MDSENLEQNIALNEKMRDFLILTIAQIIFQFIFFIRWYLLLNFLNVADFGYYSLVTRISLILTPIVSLGLGNALLIYLPKLSSKRICNRVLEQKIFFLLGISIIFFILLSYIVYISGIISSDNYVIEFFLIIVILVLTLVINNFMYLYFIAHSNITFAGIFFILQSLFPIIFVSIFIYFSMDLDDILWGINYGQVIVVIIGFLKIIQILLKNKSRIIDKSVEKHFLFKIFIKFNIFWIIFNLCYMVFRNIEPILIYDLLGLESSSIYSYLLTLSSISSLGFIAINQFLIARFSMKNNDADIIKKKQAFTDEFQSGFHFSTWVVILITLCLHNIIVFFPSIIEFDKFQGNLSFLYAIVFSEIIFGYSMLNIALLSAKEEMAKNTIAISIACLFLYILNLFFTPIFGFYGVIFIKIIIGVLLCIITTNFLKDSLYIGQTIKSSKKLILLFILSTIVSFSTIKFNLLILIILDLVYPILFFRDKMLRGFFKHLLTKFSHNSKTNNQKRK